MDIELSQHVDCLCDFTYDFYWQHRGSRLNPEGIIPHQVGTSYTYQDLVTCLKRGEDVFINGDAGRRLGSSLGVALKFFGGKGEHLKVGSIVVDGSVDTRMGISMVSGAVYVRGSIKQPLGNVIEVESDRSGYRKYSSISGILMDGLKEAIVPPNLLKGDTLFIKDGLIRDTTAARLDADRKIEVEGNVGMSTGILMKQGFIHVDGDAGMNTGVLQRGGMIVVNNTEEFAGSYMEGGTLIIRGKSKGYVGAHMKGGTIFYRGEALPRHTSPNENDVRMLMKVLGMGQIEAMMYKKYCLR